jgi:ABC-type amino acid transport substrate-binding protein
MRARWTRTARAATALAMAGSVAGSLAACGIGNASAESVAAADSLTIGVYSDRPGLSIRDSKGVYTGFDIDVAKYVARRLGVPEDHLRWRAVTVAQREPALLNGQADMVVASYSITPERMTKVGFAGPYYVAHQDIMVRADDTALHSVRDLKGKRLCQIAGSISEERIIKQRKISVTLVPASAYADCVSKLVGGSLDAVSTDDVILAGYAAQQGRRVRMVNAPFSDEPMGIGLRKNDVAGCEAVNKAITQMYQDGTAARLLARWLGASGLKPTTTVPQFQGCG